MTMLLLAAHAIFGCASAPPPTKHYRLEVPAAPTEPESQVEFEALGGTEPSMMVEEFSVDTAYDDQRIVYRESPYVLEYYYYHRWSAPPGRLVSEALREAYADTGLFARVEPAWTPGIPVILRGRVQALEEIDETKDQWVGHVELQLELLDAKTEEVLWTHHAEEYERLADRSPEGLARAVSSALQRIVQRTAPRLAAIAAGTAAEQSEDEEVAAAPGPD